MAVISTHTCRYWMLSLQRYKILVNNGFMFIWYYYHWWSCAPNRFTYIITDMMGSIIKRICCYWYDWISTMLLYQHGYEKTGNRWGAQLTNHMWTIIQSHWINRNQCLHETEALARLSGVEDLKIAIGKEYELWLGELPLVYTSYFLPPLDFILDKPTDYIRRWFLVVCSERESFAIINDIDIFSTDSALRAWVGLRLL